MNNIQKLIRLIYQEHVKNDQNFNYHYNDLDILLASICKVEFEKNHPDKWFSERDNFQPLYDAEKSLTQLLTSGYIGYCVRTGGNSGGSCYGGEASYQAEDNPQFNNDYLDKILESIAPEVTYLTYRKIEKSIIKTMEYTQSEYYGNNDIYHVQLIPIVPLIEMLEEKKCLLSFEMIEQILVQMENKDLKKKIKP